MTSKVDMKDFAKQSVRKSKSLFKTPRGKGYRERNGKFYAYLNAGGTKLYLGAFDSADEANLAFRIAHAEYQARRILAQELAQEDA